MNGLRPLSHSRTSASDSFQHWSNSSNRAIAHTPFPWREDKLRIFFCIYELFFHVELPCSFFEPGSFLVESRPCTLLQWHRLLYPLVGPTGTYHKDSPLSSFYFLALFRQGQRKSLGAMPWDFGPAFDKSTTITYHYTLGCLNIPFLCRRQWFSLLCMWKVGNKQTHKALGLWQDSKDIQFAFCNRCNRHGACFVLAAFCRTILQRQVGAKRNSF